MLLQVLGVCWLLSVMACREDEQHSQNEVNRYMLRLKAGEVPDMELPPFTSEAIPALLTYRNSNEPLRGFPRNPISSFYQSECTTGIFALWIIESVRLSYVSQAQTLPGRFPSLSPMLGWRDGSKTEMVDDAVAQQVAAAAYQAWWARSPFIGLPDLMQNDPLENTDYRWR